MGDFLRLDQKSFFILIHFFIKESPEKVGKHREDETHPEIRYNEEA